MPKGFVSLGRGMTINETLVVDAVAGSNGRYFIKCKYGESYQVDRKHYIKIKKLLDK